jgi:hypothetical protein
MAKYTEYKNVPIPIRIPDHAPNSIELEIIWDEEYEGAEFNLEGIGISINGAGGYGWLIPVFTPEKGEHIAGAFAGIEIEAKNIQDLVNVISGLAKELRRDDKCFWTLRDDYLIDVLGLK